MRREGYELQVSRPEVIFKTENENILEPAEDVWIETPEYIGWKLKLLRNTGIWLESDSIWVDLEVVGDIFEFKRKNAKH